MYDFFETAALNPNGWLKKQLEIQANGLSGNLDRIWPDVKDSAWIGGDKEGWERVPYWLDGFIPLAYLLKDKDMIARADKYINAIISRQCADGWICPCSQEERKQYDLWALILICKVLSVYCEFTGSKKAEESLYKAMKNYNELLSRGEIVLECWGHSRWFEAFIPLLFLKKRYNEEWIEHLGVLLQQSGQNYMELTELWKTPMNKWTFETHIVNICMMLKYEALSVALLGGKYKNNAEYMWKILEKYNGTAVGIFTGDECLSGIGNNQGTELCSVVELMYSLELLYAYTGDNIWADRLEKVAYNALPATLSDDMWTHQYDQLANQIACLTFNGKPIFRTNGPDAHIFGIEPCYGCCTANFSQGWPKLAMSVFLITEKGILCSLMLPYELDTTVNGKRINIKTNSEYPFRNSCEFIITAPEPIEFEFKIRIPKWAKSFKINGSEVQSEKFAVINKVWTGSDTISVEFEAEAHLVDRPHKLKTAEYGPLVFVLPIKTKYIPHEYTRNGVELKAPYCDYELAPESAWNYGFANSVLEPTEKAGDEIPFSSKNPRLTLKATLAPVNWKYEDGYDTVSAKTPVSRKAMGQPQTVELYPYGCAKLRMTEMPLVK